MPLIWTGLGFLVPVVAFLSLMVMQTAVDSFYQDGYYTEHQWAQDVAIVVAAILVFIVGYLLNRPQRLIIDLNLDTGMAQPAANRTRRQARLHPGLDILNQP